MLHFDFRWVDRNDDDGDGGDDDGDDYFDDDGGGVLPTISIMCLMVL